MSPWAAGVVAAGLAVAVGPTRASSRTARRRLRALPPGAQGTPALAGFGAVTGRVGRSGRRRWPSRRAALLTLVGHFRWGAHGSETEHAELLEAVARSLRAGASLPTGLEQAVQLGSGDATAELARVLVAVGRGAPLGPALDRWAAGDDPVRAMTGVALSFGAEVGGARARALDEAAAGLRDRAELAREIRALTSQARASAAVMVVAPVAFAGVGWLTGGVSARVFTTPLGLVCLAAGLALDLLGAWWMASWTRSVG